MSDKDYSKPASSESIKKAEAALTKHGFSVRLVDNLDEASQEVFKTIPKGSEVFTATSVTLDKAGISKIINESGDYESVRAKFAPLAGQADRAIEMRRIGSGSDYTLGSVHALTEDGQVLVASRSGSQLPNYVYGANHVIWVVGSQKIVKNLGDGLERLEKYTLPLEDKRAQAAYGINSSLDKILIYRKDSHKRVTIIIVKDAVGF